MWRKITQRPCIPKYVPLKCPTKTAHKYCQHAVHTKPIWAIPGPKGLPVLGTIPTAAKHGAFKGRIHKYFDWRQQKHGAIYREKLGDYSAVYIHRPSDIEYLLRNEGKYPSRTTFSSWMLHREEAGLPLGLLLQTGEAWRRQRSALDPHLLKPASVGRHVVSLDSATQRLVDVLEERMSGPRGTVVEDLQPLLFRWSLESACLVLFGKAVGCMTGADGPESEDVQRFISSVQDVLRLTERLLLVPPRLARTLHLPVWRNFVTSSNSLYQSAFNLMQKKPNGSTTLFPKPDLDQQGFITQLSLNGTLPQGDLQACAVDLMQGSVDTTSTTALWTLYLLASNPREQEVLRQEINAVLPSNGNITYQQLQNLPLLKAVVKESLRLFPVAPVLARILQENVTIQGYQLPAGTLVNIPLTTLRYMHSLYREPRVFRPQRWLRSHSQYEDIHPFASLPFGFGPRACIGRRVAETELYLLLIRLLQSYYIYPADPLHNSVSDVTRIVLLPDQPIRLKFIPVENKF